MRYQRDLPHGVVLADEPRGLLDLPTGIVSRAKRFLALRRLRHVRISVRMTIAVKIKPPDVETPSTKFVAPGSAIEAMGNRQRRRKRRAVHIQRHSLRRHVLVSR